MVQFWNFHKTETLSLYCPIISETDSFVARERLYQDNQDSPDQCPMPINADQNHGIDPKCLSMPIIADQCWSFPLNWDELIGIHRHWNELIDIGINARTLILIDLHWALTGGVLDNVTTFLALPLGTICVENKTACKKKCDFWEQVPMTFIPIKLSYPVKI